MCLIIIVITSFHSHSQTAEVHKNEYGLRVISSSKEYKSSIQHDINKRMVRLKYYLKAVVFDWRYATTANFTKKVLYQKPDGLVRREVAIALQQVATELSFKGIGLKFFDTYRPYHVTKVMWEIMPDDRYAANPAKGSGHNRGAAVDVTLVSLNGKKELAMPSGFDDFTEKAHHSYMALPEEIIANRLLLRSTMEKHGFVALETEWWHYSIPDASAKYELLDINFNKLKKLAKE
jgi:D-alanyl-D-alanine dipeptidase